MCIFPILKNILRLLENAERYKEHTMNHVIPHRDHHYCIYN